MALGGNGRDSDEHDSEQGNDGLRRDDVGDQAARHSIIIEPNVPVIIGKKAQHDFLFAVYEGTTREDVKAYLADEEIRYRKIHTTPEGFDKKFSPPCTNRA